MRFELFFPATGLKAKMALEFSALLSVLRNDGEQAVLI